MVNGVPWEVPESTQCTPKEFSKGEPEATSKARPNAKDPTGRRPRGCLAFGLAEDVAKGSHLENAEGSLQYSSKGPPEANPEGSILYLPVMPYGKLFQL